MKPMQKPSSHDLEIQSFIKDCRALYKISSSAVKNLIYTDMTDNFMPEVLDRITSETEQVTNLFENMAQLETQIHSNLFLQYKYSVGAYHYEVWMQRVLFQLDALLLSLRRIIYKLLKLYNKESLATAIRLIKFSNKLITISNSVTSDNNFFAESSSLNQETKKKITIHRILKIVARTRTEECAFALVHHLMRKYNEMDRINYPLSDTTDIEEEVSNIHDEEIQPESDSTSILVYKTLAQYASPPRSPVKTPNSKKENEIENQEASLSFFITFERKRLTNLFSIINSDPHDLLTEQELVISKRTGCIKMSNKVKQKLLEVYEQILWQNIGIFSEHVLLWWANFALGRKNQLVSQKFAAWLKHYFSTANINAIVQPTIHSLIDCLCCYITSTSWDELYSQALISANNQHSRHNVQNIGLGTKTGHLFSDMLYDVVFLTNSCEGSNWTIQDLENLPLVEQIPLLHRLDHSIHSVRIWAIGRAKYLTNSWNMEQFFRVTHVDVNASLYALSQLKLSQNVKQLNDDNSHFIVCSKMRSKLVSEVNINIEKLHEVSNRSLTILSAVCKITSLAYLKICFPPNLYWQQQYQHHPKTASEYVEKYLDEILKPVLLASQNLPLPVQKSVSKLVLEILCEAWLDHIYKFRIKFSEWGAIQLLLDFGTIPVWIKDKIPISNDIRLFLTSDEILRRCEGVGRLLLRHPGESIIMTDENKNSSTAEAEMESKESENTAEGLMPPEMYVPNQEKWLELRMNQQKSSMLICC